MFGGGGPQEDMFAKLESMREIITEVNTQFKNPVSLGSSPWDALRRSKREVVHREHR